MDYFGSVFSAGEKKPVIFFNASARLVGLNLNAAFSMISSWGIQLAGRKIYHFACNSGMSHCVLGAGLGDPKAAPPCRSCINDTKRFTGSAERFWFDFQDHILRKKVYGFSQATIRLLWCFDVIRMTNQTSPYF